MAALHKAGFTQSRPWRASEFAELLAHPAVFATGDRHGFALARVVGDEAELLTITTHPAARRRGLARALMQAWQDEAVARGAQMAFLEVAADNAAARALYAACGFEPSGLRRGYYSRADAPAADAVVMARALTRG